MPKQRCTLSQHTASKTRAIRASQQKSPTRTKKQRDEHTVVTATPSQPFLSGFSHGKCIAGRSRTECDRTSGSYQCREIIFPNAPSAKGNEQYSCTVKQTTKNKRGKGVTISKQVFTDPVPQQQAPAFHMALAQAEEHEYHTEVTANTSVKCSDLRSS